MKFLPYHARHVIPDKLNLSRLRTVDKNGGYYYLAD